MSNLIIHGRDCPYEQLAFDPSNPEELPAETYQYLFDASRHPPRVRVRYIVRSKWCESESKMSIEYRAEDQAHLPEGWPSAEKVEFWYWGVHILAIEPGKKSGPSTWRDDPWSEPDIGPGWRLEQVSERISGGRKKGRKTATQIKREQQGPFRDQLLEMDGCCALTGETCETSLEAAHIIPAYQGGLEYPENGMLLRADIHRLFDAGKIQICPKSGQVMVGKDFDYPSYPLMKEAQVSERVLERIRTQG